VFWWAALAAACCLIGSDRAPGGSQPPLQVKSSCPETDDGGGSHVAVGDIISCAINADGRSATAVVEGVDVGGTYLWDAANDHLVDLATAKVVFTVTSKGFDASGNPTTIQRTVQGTLAQRVPGTAGLDETFDGNCTIVFGLNEPIYSKDKTGAGNSGTDPTVAFLANWYTQGGHASRAASLTCTNNSALDYFVPFGQWDILPAEVIESDFRVGFIARHLHGIAAVKFTATGATSAHAETATTASETKRQRPVTQLYGTCHEVTLPISGFTQAEQIDLRCYVYPLVGDAAMDTADYAADYEVTGHTPQWVVCNKSGTLWVYGTVSASGNDGTGVASTTLATADAAPFLTIEGAIDAGATKVYLKETANTFASRSTRKTGNYWTTVERHPTNSSTTTVAAASGFCITKVQRLRFSGVTISPGGSSTGVFYGVAEGDFLAFENCVLDSGGTTVAVYHFDFDAIYHAGCTFDDGSKWKPTSFGTVLMRFAFDGCDMPMGSTDQKSCWRLIACRVTDTILFEQNSSSDTKPFNLLFEFNEIISALGSMIFGASANTTGTSIVGNVIEGVGVSPSELISIAESAGFDIEHVLLCHNTLVGERSNIAYNDSGSTAYYRRGWRIVGNIFDDFNTKHDTFGTPDANRVGGWWIDYGTCIRANMTLRTNSGFHGDYFGLRQVINGTPDFADDQSGAGSGGGDYTLGASSDALGVLSGSDAVVPYDLFGKPINNAGLGACGAIQPEPPPDDPDPPDEDEPPPSGLPPLAKAALLQSGRAASGHRAAGGRRR